MTLERPKAVAFVLKRRNKYLMVVEPNGVLGGKFNLPTTFIGKEESAETCTRRLALQATGFELGAVKPLIECEIRIPSSESIAVVVFAAKLANGKVPQAESRRLETFWFSREEIEAIGRRGNLISGLIPKVLEKFEMANAK